MTTPTRLPQELRARFALAWAIFQAVRLARFVETAFVEVYVLVWPEAHGAIRCPGCGRPQRRRQDGQAYIRHRRACDYAALRARETA